MDKQTTVKLLDETFSNDFDIHRFAKFIKELFNNFNINQKSWTVWSEYQDYIESYNSLGSYTDKSKKVIDVLIVKLKRTSSRDRARTMQRNFIAKYLGNTDKDAALVAFYGDDEDWRFSFVKMEYNLMKDEDGKAKVAKELTPAKRYSFLVGKNEPNHICKRQFLELVMEDEINPSAEEIEDAFSIDNVTKEFFIEYKGLYLKLKDALERHIKKDSFIRKEFEENAITTVDFSKKLLGQIVFIYFLQKKGWLGVQKDKSRKFMGWGTGPKNFLRKLFEKKTYKNFFNDVLEPLFYEALATERDDDYYSRFECKIPFLNGGLFEPINEYNWRETDLLLDNSIFENILNTFDRFNFTVKEDEPLEKEVAIDPEILGKVFENLIEENIRKGQGAYYTPREIVHYMCQQSLINYLETNTSINREDIEKLIQLGNLTLASSIRVLQEIDKKQEKLKKGIISANIFEKEVKEELEKLDLPKSIVNNYKEIDRLLKEIKIVDPAVGSGAFPVGMMNEIVKVRSILSIFFSDEEQKKRTNYNLKREVIENCLYGVDIDSSAVDIAKLRFWLSLIVDELDMKNIQPLPNLDHKIMCGNSLLEEFEGHKLFDDKLLEEAKKDYSFEIKQIDAEISKLNHELHQIHTGKIKNHNDRSKEIVNKIKKLQRKKEQILSAPKEQVQQSTIGDSLQKRIKESQKKLKELRELQQKLFNEQNRKLKKQYRDEIERIEWEFVEETLKEQGHEEAMKKLQKFKKDKSKPFFLWKLYFAEVFQRENPGFDVVIANPPYVNIKDISESLRKQYIAKFNVIGRQDLYILFIEKGIHLMRNQGVMSYISSNKFIITKNGKNIRKMILDNCKIIVMLDVSHCDIFKEASIYPIIYLFRNEHQNLNRIENLIQIAKFCDDDLIKGRLFTKELFTQIAQKQFYGSFENIFEIYNTNNFSEIMKKINQKAVKLKIISDIRNGIIVGDQKKYVIDENDFQKLNRNQQVKFKKVLGGRNVYYYGYEWNKEYILYDKNVLVAPRDESFFIEPKIIIRDIALRLTAAYDTKCFYCLQTLNVLKITNKNINYKYLLAILNSQLINFVYSLQYSSVHVGGNYNRYRERYIQELPIILATGEEQKPIVLMVEKILVTTLDEDYLDNPEKQSKVKKLEKEIDQLVYKLYELTPEEIKIVEEFGK